MKHEVHVWLSTLFASKLANAYKVGDVFSNYFGEELVDTQYPRIQDCIDSINNICLNEMLPVRLLEDGTVRLPDSIVISLEEWNTIRMQPALEALEGVVFEAAKSILESKVEEWLYYHDTTIIVRFPRVTVTNEHDASIEITELYAKVMLSKEGTIRGDLQFMRAEYTASQYRSNYAHSHLPGVSFDWQYPCLGSGPIRRTLNTVTQTCDLEIWGLFCYELEKYVSVESLDGVPYRRLEDVGLYAGGEINPFPYPRAVPLDSYPTYIVHFTKYFLRTHQFKVAFTDGVYSLGCSPVDFLIELSKCFVEWYNKRAALRARVQDCESLKGNGILTDYVIVNKKLHWPFSDDGHLDVRNAQGRALFEFKGKVVTLNITDTEQPVESTSVTLLNHDIANSIITRCLQVINYSYGHKETTNTTGQKVRIL